MENQSSMMVDSLHAIHLLASTDGLKCLPAANVHSMQLRFAVSIAFTTGQIRWLACSFAHKIQIFSAFFYLFGCLIFATLHAGCSFQGGSPLVHSFFKNYLVFCKLSVFDIPVSTIFSS